MTQKEELDQELRDRAVFRRVFSTDEGIQVYAWIGNQCGAWSTVPEHVNPDLVAFFNQLRLKLGIVHPWNIFELAAKDMQASNDEDIAVRRKQINESEKGDREHES